MTAGTPYATGGDRPRERDLVRFATSRVDWRVFAVGNYTDGPFWVSLEQVGGTRKRYMVPASRLRLFRKAAS